MPREKDAIYSEPEEFEVFCCECGSHAEVSITDFNKMHFVCLTCDAEEKV